jgi:multisite-specific tRNA:(cytosine-C5)-methyltransferase
MLSQVKVTFPGHSTVNSITLGFTLIDASSSYPELIRKSGLTTWKPAVDKAVNLFESLESYIGSVTDEKQKQSHKILGSLWPPSNVEELNLQRWYAFNKTPSSFILTPSSMRIYPHHQDSGGFFVAILEKIKYPSTTEQKSRCVKSNGPFLQLISQGMENDLPIA